MVVKSETDAKLTGPPLVVGRVKRILTLIRSIFLYGVDEEILTKNPAKGIKLPNDDNSKVVPLTVEESFAFVAVKDFFWYGDAFVFQLQTGLRNQELMALIWDDIDWENKTLRIERAVKWVRGMPIKVGKVKSKRSKRVIELEQEHIDFLLDHRKKQEEHIHAWETSGHCYGGSEIQKWINKARRNQASQYKDTRLIFPDEAGAIPGADSVRNEFKSMLVKAGLPKDRVNEVRWYDLRHTHATYLLTLGFPDHEVAERLGHTVKQLNDTYAHVLPNRQRRASKVFVRLIPMKVTTMPDANELSKRIASVAVEINQDDLSLWNFMGAQ